MKKMFHGHQRPPAADRLFDTLIFDLGKVVVDFDPLRALSKLDGKASHPVDNLLSLLQKSTVMGRFERGEINTLTFFREVAALIGLKMGLDEFISIWEDIFLEDLLLDERFLLQFKPRYQLLALSNTNEMHMHYLRRRFHVMRVFDSLVLSYEVGAMKPAVEMYQAAMRVSGTSPGKIFYVDDLSENISVAAQCGWTAVQFVNRQQLEADLRRLGILPSESMGLPGAECI